MNIVTEPTPGGHWRAWDDDQFDGPGSPIGIGETEEEARDDLLEQIDTPFLLLRQAG